MYKAFGCARPALLLAREPKLFPFLPQPKARAAWLNSFMTSPEKEIPKPIALLLG
jgi:hypothetical protein